jgi:hypothetical protein
MDDEHKKKLTRALARLVACKKQLDEHRETLQRHASDRLDAVQTETNVAAKHMDHSPNVLTYRYSRRAMTEAARLRAIALRAEHSRAKDADKS